ncbi:hypothetical protein PRZ48_013027 [Zasmidium cellare]|uniref:Uncharacterized protein n=1 Tax=Zasmidium cellare TaxID=395010 RepID=A0ABR0E2X1_ZASCE|nr:hypothetical protein PRZ48_013027 [Zasmidium cellare]
MACVDSTFQPNFHDPMALRRGSIQRMSNTPLLRTAQEAKLVDFRIYESQPTSPRMPAKQHPHRSSFVKRCSQLATGRRPSITSTSSTTTQPPNLVQWVQRLPSSPSGYEDFLESALEEAVGQLVCGPNAAAEEFELGYNYDTLEDTAPEAWVRVQAQRVESQGKQWIAASIQSKAGPEVYAYGREDSISTIKLILDSESSQESVTATGSIHHTTWLVRREERRDPRSLNAGLKSLQYNGPMLTTTDDTDSGVMVLGSEEGLCACFDDGPVEPPFLSLTESEELYMVRREDID